MARTKSSSRVSINDPRAEAIEGTARKTTGREPPTASARARKTTARKTTALPKKSKKRDVEEIPPVEDSSESESLSGDNNLSHERADDNSSDDSGSDKGNVGSEEVNSQGEESSEASGEESSEASGEESSETSGEQGSQEVREGGETHEGSEACEGGDGRKRRPFDKGMYPNFASHVASMLVADEPKERNALKCKMPTVDAWCLENEDEEVINLVKSTPLYNLLSSYKTYDPVIISAFVERWHPETNTFHLPIGEMTITLDDVYQLTHLPITGKALFPKSQPKEKTMSAYVARVLGVSDNEARQEIATNRANSLRLGWLVRKFSKNERSKPENAGVFKGTNEDLARAFLLRLIGCTIFCDSSVDKVPVRYLRFLEDLSTVGEWAWGAATLAFLYRKLGHATRIEAKLLVGYRTLLQAWVYEHFAFLRPNETKNVASDVPRMLKWEPKTRIGKKHLNSSVTVLRMKLDGLKKDQVTWTPYRSKDASPDEVVWFIGCLIIDDIKEPYHPDRVVRQFGRIQGLHSPPIAPSEESRSSKTKAYKVKYDEHPDDYFNYKNHVLNTSSRGLPMQVDGECMQEYEDWYNAHALRRLNYVGAEGSAEKDRPVIHVVADEKDVTKKLQEADKAIGMIRKAVSNKKITKAELVQVCEEAVRVYDDANKRKTRRSFEEASTSSIPPKKKKKVVPSLRL